MCPSRWFVNATLCVFNNDFHSDKAVLRCMETRTNSA